MGVIAGLIARSAIALCYVLQPVALKTDGILNTTYGLWLLF